MNNSGDGKPYTGCNVCIHCNEYRDQPPDSTHLGGCQCGHIDIAHANPEKIEI